MKPIIQLLTLAAATLFVSCAALSNLMLPVTQGGTMTFTQLCGAGQVKSPFEDGALSEAVAAADEWLAANAEK